jgi:RNA polymerase sigma-70 factor (ECF subfamily)
LDAEELGQEVYLRACRKIETLRDPAKSKKWLFRIAKNVCLNHLKKEKQRLLYFLKIDTETREYYLPERRLIEKERYRAFLIEMNRLSKEQKEVLILRAYNSLSYKDIAKIYGIRKGTAITRSYRARKKLITQLKENMRW